MLRKYGFYLRKVRIHFYFGMNIDIARIKQKIIELNEIFKSHYF